MGHHLAKRVEGAARISRLIAAGLGLMLAGAAYLNVDAARLQDKGSPARPTTGGAQSPARPAVPQPSAATYRAVLDQYCVSCHNDRLKTGGVTLDTADIEHLNESGDVWEKVAHMLRTGAMPPAGRKRPDAATAQSLAGWLEHGLDEIADAAPNAGRLPPHRLNRTEYVNAVRDLLGLDVPVSSLPADGSLLGFDNIAGGLSVSPMLLERYMSVARRVSRLAIGDITMNIAPVTYPIETSLKQADRLNEDLPFGSRGISLHHTFPLDGDYVIDVRLKRNNNEYIRGMGRRPQPLEVRLDGVRLQRFAEAGVMKGMPGPEGYVQEDLGDPDWEKSMLDSDAAFSVRFPAAAGTRTIGVALEARHWESDEEFILPLGAVGRGEEERDGNIVIATVSVSGPYGTKTPTDSVSRQKIFVCHPAGAGDEERCASTILSKLAQRAYRRPVTDKDMRLLLGFCRAGRVRGFDGCIENALERILSSPHFLFRVESEPPSAGASNTPSAGVTTVLARAVSAPPGQTAPEPDPGRPYRISDVDLASRLSFFLWSSIPDDALLEAAMQGKLHEPVTLTQHVKRMLADPRSRSLVDNFAAQWLQLRSVESASPASDLFPAFDGDLKEAFREETEHLLDSMLRGDRPIAELLTANYTYVNERLARHYGIPNIVGSHFRRVTLTDPVRMGLLGQGSVLTVTSQATRTSPVLRGKFVLENILGAPVPPPPPNIPALKSNGDGGVALTGRALLEQHRENSVCANCHARMDPWGFALENFDATGAWRATDGAAPIDAKATLLDGTALDGPAGVRRVLVARREQFVHTVTEKLLVYALGRPVEYYDRPALRKITRATPVDEMRWSTVILGIINSMPFQFQMRGAI